MLCNCVVTVDIAENRCIFDDERVTVIVAQITLLGWRKWYGCWGEPANWKSVPSFWRWQRSRRLVRRTALATTTARASMSGASVNLCCQCLSTLGVLTVWLCHYDFVEFGNILLLLLLDWHTVYSLERCRVFSFTPCLSVCSRVPEGRVLIIVEWLEILSEFKCFLSTASALHVLNNLSGYTYRFGMYRAAIFRPSEEQDIDLLHIELAANPLLCYDCHVK